MANVDQKLALLDEHEFYVKLHIFVLFISILSLAQGISTVVVYFVSFIIVVTFRFDFYLCRAFDLVDFNTLFFLPKQKIEGKITATASMEFNEHNHVKYQIARSKNFIW